MSVEQGFLAAIIANPDDDTPRLVYSDWLEEQGGAANLARAEYLRLEIQLARVDLDAPPTPELQANRKRSRELFAKHSREWFPAFVGPKHLLRGSRSRTHFKRGFPYEIYAKSPKILEVGDELVRLAPITSVDFQKLTNSPLQKLVKAPWIAHLRKMVLDGANVPLEWSALAGCP